MVQTFAMPPRRGTDYETLLASIRMDDDGLPMRPVKEWTPNKLALISYYLPQFAKLCDEKAGGWYFLDGFAGNGANWARDLGRFKGSALLGALMQPPARRVVLIEEDSKSAQTLKTRCERERPDAVIIEGDCNERITEALGRFDNRGLPAFCVLDPEGLELGWDVVQVCRGHREVSTPYELLIYFSTPGVMRTASVTDERMIKGDERALRRVFGNDDWRVIAERQRAGELDGNEAGREYLALYKGQLEGLGYEYVLSRPSFRTDGNLVYHLVFATAHDAARDIMSLGLQRAYAGQLPLQF